MFDLKVINSVLSELEEERGIPRAKVLEAIEIALATAYKKEYGKRGQIVRAVFNGNTGDVEFFQVMRVVDESKVRTEEEITQEDTSEDNLSVKKSVDKDTPGEDVNNTIQEEDKRVRFDPEKHIFLEDAQKIKKDAQLDEELVFPLEKKDNYGRIAAQTAKQVIIQKIREAEKVSMIEEFGERQGEIVTGVVQRIERGNIYVDLGRAAAIMPYDEQIPGERYRTGERIRSYLYSVEESPRGVFLRISRSHPRFLEKLFELETPEILAGTVEIKAIAREPGSRSKVAVVSHDEHIDPVGSLVGQRGVRVSTVMSELGGEKIDVIEWSEDVNQFIEDALSPALVLEVSVNEDEHKATVEVSADQQSLAIGRGGQNVRLAAKLTGWKIDIRSLEGQQIAKADEEGVNLSPESSSPESGDSEVDKTEEKSENTNAGELKDEEETEKEKKGTKDKEISTEEKSKNN